MQPDDTNAPAGGIPTDQGGTPPADQPVTPPMGDQSGTPPPSPMEPTPQTPSPMETPQPEVPVTGTGEEPGSGNPSGVGGAV